MVAVNRANVARGINFFIAYSPDWGFDEVRFRRSELPEDCSLRPGNGLFEVTDGQQLFRRPVASSTSVRARDSRQMVGSSRSNGTVLRLRKQAGALSVAQQV